MIKTILTSKWTKAVIFSLCLLPLAVLIWRGFQHNLTANPIEFITHTTGDWTLRFLALTLAISPLRKIASSATIDSLSTHVGALRLFLCVLAFRNLDWP